MIKWAIEVLLCAFCCPLMSVITVSAAVTVPVVPDGGRNVNTQFIDRLSLKTNAFEWLLTIPNIGFEFDLKNSEFNNMSLGLTAKYNWNTYHKYAPPTVFNLLDVRPEFRYYYRTRPLSKGKTKWSVDRFLKERKNPRTWRAQYIGAYADYGSYTIKFGKKGYQGMVIGFGATAGYAVPMYEYKKGAVDVELGFSVGFQFAEKDVFVHSPDGYYYSSVADECKDLHFTPFPVVSELKVAFVWRHKSIKDKVKTDDEKLKIKRHYERNKGDYSQPFESLTKAYYDEMLVNTKSSKELREIRGNDSLYFAGYQELLARTREDVVRNLEGVFPDDMKNSEREDMREYVRSLEKKLEGIMNKSKKTAFKKFRKEVSSVNSKKAKTESKAEKEKKTAEKKAEKKK